MKTVVFIYIFIFACLFKMHATQPQPKVQQQPKDCVKHPQIVKPQSVEKSKVVAEKVVKDGAEYNAKKYNGFKITINN